MSIQQLQTVLPNGQLPLSYLTGNPADLASSITLVHRSKDSGTRVTAFADAFGTGLAPQVYYWNTISLAYTLATKQGSQPWSGPAVVEETDNGSLKLVLVHDPDSSAKQHYLRLRVTRP